MNFLCRAFLSVKRNFGKTFLLFLLIVIFGSAISVSILMNQAAEITEQNLRSRMLPVAMIEFSWERWDEIHAETGGIPNPTLSPKSIREVGELPYVKSFEYSAIVYLYNPNLEHYEPKDLYSGNVLFVGGTSNLYEPFEIKGTNNPHILDIEGGIIELVAGRTFLYEEIDNLSFVAIISEAFAHLNGLGVGSTISLGMLEGVYDNEQFIVDATYSLDVIGIFRPTIVLNPEDPFGDFLTFHLIQNRIYTPNNFAKMVAELDFDKLTRDDDLLLSEEEFDFNEIVWFDNLFLLYSSNYLSDFRASVAEMVPEHFRVIDTGNAFRGIFLSLETMNRLISRILWLTVGTIIIILTLLIILFLRSRKREIEIYLALGEKKEAIIMQIAGEIMMISTFAIVVALFIGYLIADSLGQTMLQNHLIAEQENNVIQLWGSDYLAEMGFRIKDTVEDIKATYNVVLTMRAVIEFMVMSLSTLFIVAVIPLFYVIRINPKNMMN